MMRAFYRPRTRPASHDLSQPPSITLIAGPTASGKSALALKMARETGAVIINADSQQLYADMRILTARPSVEDEALADHRLYGVADAADAWSVGRWSRAALNILDELRADGRPAIVVGGTGLYFMSLTRGLANIPAVADALRNQVEADYAAQGEATFRKRLAEVDANAANAIEKGDRQRLVRAMSVHSASGRSLSEWKEETSPLLRPGSWTGLVIEPNRQRLYDSCDRRIDAMMRLGVADEVRNLISRGLSPINPAMRAIGVKELAMLSEGEISEAEAIIALKKTTRNYAKRQLTWFRNQTPEWARRI